MKKKSIYKKFPKNHLKKENLNKMVYLCSRHSFEIMDNSIRRILENANISEAK